MGTKEKNVNIIYEIEFFSNWHCGSGLAAGADVDALVVKDKQGLPYVPGRTLKGLLREAANELANDQTKVNLIFGISGDQEKWSEEIERVGCAFFGNATLNDGQAIASAGLVPYLYQTFSSTAIDENGIADEATLRKIETVVPCTLSGAILNIPKDDVDLIEEAMSFIKRMGTGRTRGYGRCQIRVTGKEDVK